MQDIAVLEGTEVSDVENIIKEKLTAFDEALQGHSFLEIDGDIEADSPEKHVIKVINHNTEEAHSVTVDAIMRHRVATLVRALESGITIRLYGITRIVGYYSRVNNWNKSKQSELADRHKGSYKLRDCKDL